MVVLGLVKHIEFLHFSNNGFGIAFGCCQFLNDFFDDFFLPTEQDEGLLQLQARGPGRGALPPAAPLPLLHGGTGPEL